MDKSAIEQIQQHPTVTALLRAVEATDTPIICLPEDFRVESLEKYMQFRSRFRGKMETDSIKDFVQYVSAHDAEGAGCFIDAEHMRAKTIFNLGTLDEPGHADFTAALALEKTAEYAALLKLNGEKRSQKDLAEWCEDWAPFITFCDADNNAIELKRGISAIRNLTIEASRKEDHNTQNFSASKSALEKIEARSEHGVPAGLEFNCVPYDGLNAQSFDCRLSILTGESAPKLVVRVRRLESRQQDIAAEFRAMLTDRFKPLKLDCYLGDFSAQP